jgi:hypothetical protein
MTLRAAEAPFPLNQRWYSMASYGAAKENAIRAMDCDVVTPQHLH